MSTLFGWRTWIVAIPIALFISISLFIATERQLYLSGLDLFFASTTVLSLGINLWQLLRDRYKYAPLKNSLIGLFNDLKARQLRAHQRQLLIKTNEGMRLDVEAVRLEFYDYVQENVQSLGQLREHVVAAVHTLDPEVSTQQVFRAADFGLTDQERAFQDQAMQRFYQQATDAGVPGTRAGPGNENR